MLEGFNKIGCDAINVGHYEMLNGLSYLKDISQRQIYLSFLPIQDPSTNELIFEPYIILERGDLRIGVAGVTNHSHFSKSMLADDYIESANHYAELLSKGLILLFMLVNADRGLGDYV